MISSTLLYNKKINNNLKMMFISCSDQISPNKSCWNIKNLENLYDTPKICLILKKIYI